MPEQVCAFANVQSQQTLPVASGQACAPQPYSRRAFIPELRGTRVPDPLLVLSCSSPTLERTWRSVAEARGSWSANAASVQDFAGALSKHRLQATGTNLRVLYLRSAR